MRDALCVQPLGWHGRVADALMVPLMYMLQGTFRESPQRTHFWNNAKLSLGDITSLESQKMVHCAGLPTSTIRQRLGPLPIFHIPILSGWRDYVVIEPVEQQAQWHVGWIADVVGLSRIPLRSSVRLLVGVDGVSFFGVTPHGTQISLKKIGRGRIGDYGPFSSVPLL